MFPELSSPTYLASKSIFRRRRDSIGEDSLSVSLIQETLSRDDFDPPYMPRRCSMSYERFNKRFSKPMKIGFASVFIVFITVLGVIGDLNHEQRFRVKRLKDRQVTFKQPMVFVQGSFDKSISRYHRNTMPTLEVYNSIQHHIDKLQLKAKEMSNHNSKETDCVVQARREIEPRPTCNSVHEIDFLYGLAGCAECIHPLGRGGTRDVWLYEPESYDASTNVILKTLRLNRAFDKTQLEQHNFDAMASEQLTFSPHIINIYSYCGHSAINEYASGGDADRLHKRFPQMSMIEKMAHARDLARGLSDIQNLIGPLSLVHGDLKPCNIMISHDGKLKIDDFNNGAPLLRSNRNCEVLWPHRCDQVGLDTYMRSPEECNYHLASEKSDVYSLGGLLYFLLSGSKPYRNEPIFLSDGQSMRQLYQSVSDKEILAFDALTYSIESALTFAPEERPSAKWIAEFLGQALIHVN